MSTINDIKNRMKKSEKFIDIGTHRLRVVLSELPSEHTIVLEAVCTYHKRIIDH